MHENGQIQSAEMFWKASFFFSILQRYLSYLHSLVKLFHSAFRLRNMHKNALNNNIWTFCKFDSFTLFTIWRQWEMKIVKSRILKFSPVMLWCFTMFPLIIWSIIFVFSVSRPLPPDPSVLVTKLILTDNCWGIVHTSGVP